MDSELKGKGEILKWSLTTMQVCVPDDWTDEEIEEFANRENPTGISSRWQVTQDGDSVLNGDPSHNSCSEFDTRMHVLLIC